MSRQYFDFSTLIEAFENDFEVVTREESGYDKKGDWQAGQDKKTTLRGAIIAFKESKVLRSDGAITTKDRRLFMQQPLPQALIGAKVIYREQEYMIESELENAEFTGVYSYYLRWCSAIDTVQ